MSAESEKYEVLEKIGHGSFGVIRRVRRKEDGFIMCRKEISYLRMSQKEREQLHAEFQILSHLRHANIVAYYHREHLKVSQDLHLYMEYCGNGDLGRVIKDLAQKGQRAQESFVWSIFSQLVSALYRCHYGMDPPEVGANVLGLCASAPPKAAGGMTVLHRDLKPENVFLGEDNSVKLGDFGLSKMIKSHDFASTYVGTPFYMSPEICAAEKYTLKSDIWSLGCIIYELCSLEPPFNAKSHFQLVQKIKEGKVNPLPDFYSPELIQVIKDCLKINPDRRPDTAQLLNLPVVRLMRKEKEVVDLNKTLRSREDAVARREKELNDRIAALEGERTYMRQEIEASLRREWEVKARLEIDKNVSLELEQLQQRFESEVQARVDAQLQQKQVTFSAQPPLSSSLTGSASSSTSQDFVGTQSSNSNTTASTVDDAPPASEVVDPLPDPSVMALKKSARTPFARAQTMFAGHAAGAGAGTPMDIEMVSPSPMAIASLSLSPRRNARAKAPMVPTGNIFAANAAANRNKEAQTNAQRWNIARDVGLFDSDDDEQDDDDDEEETVPSPTRHIKSFKNNPNANKNPFTSKTRPVLTSAKSTPIHRLRGNTNKTLPTLPDLSRAAAVAATNRDGLRSPSPNRRLSKIPSATNLGGHTQPQETRPASASSASSTSSTGSAGSGSDTTPASHLPTSSNSLLRKPSIKKDSASSVGDSLGKIAAASSKANSNSGNATGGLRGRTLVELQQARAGGRPLSAVLPVSASSPSLATTGGAENVNVSPKRAYSGNSKDFSSKLAAAERRLSNDQPSAPLWDPERDEMPSPFLVRTRKTGRV